nr:MAG TPA: hypothetical protein [Bacteriophage sp.]
MDFMSSVRCFSNGTFQIRTMESINPIYVLYK